MSVPRRAFLGLAAGAFVKPAFAAMPRFAVIDWGLFETALALDALPVAATELRQFRQIVIEPPVPEGIADLGLRGVPNYEVLRMAHPDFIYISNFYRYQRPGLEVIAPVEELPLYEPGIPPYQPAVSATSAMGERLGRGAAAQALIAETQQQIERTRKELAPFASRPVYVVSLGDARHFRAFGADSMFGDVLQRLGFANAWNVDTSYSATAAVGLEALANTPDASLVVVGPVPPEARFTLSENAVWNALPMIRDRRFAIIDPVNHFGCLPSARRFTRLFATAMRAMGEAG
jgi:iron complex transport system substrate-binding protein